MFLYCLHQGGITNESPVLIPMTNIYSTGICWEVRFIRYQFFKRGGVGKPTAVFNSSSIASAAE